MPDTLEILIVVMAATSGSADDPRIEVASGGDCHAEIHIGLATIVGMSAKFSDGKPESGMPFQPTGQAPSGGFDSGAAVARM